MKLEAPMVAIFPLLVSILLMNTFSMNFTTAQSTPFPARVGVVVDMDSDVGKMRLSCIEMAISDYYTRHGYYQTRLVLDKRDVVGAAAAAMVNHISYLDVQCNLEIHDEIVARSDRKKADTYDELVYAVHQGKFDAAVGDVTILANRSQYVDFNLLYTEAGISMVVAMKSNKSKNAWVFLADALEQVHILYWTVIPSSATDDEIVARSDHKKAGTYDELVLANRSQYVNFTLPYTEAGISSFCIFKATDMETLFDKLLLICFHGLLYLDS